MIVIYNNNGSANNNNNNNISSSNEFTLSCNISLLFYIVNSHNKGIIIWNNNK